MATLVREAVDRILEDDDRETRWARAMSVVGKYRSGKKDIAVRHDEYLAEDFA